LGLDEIRVANGTVDGDEVVFAIKAVVDFSLKF
jgi:hypothetical protein